MSFIELNQIHRWYGKFHALRDVSLSLEPGRIGLLGPNGAGKSTLLKILLGLLPPSQGSGTVLGHCLTAPEPEKSSLLGKLIGRIRNPFLANGANLRRTIGYMSEADSLIPGLHGAEYVALAGELYGMPRKQAQRRAHEVLTYLELGEARYRKLEEYSTGMKQRLKLAQALVHDPPVLLLDEPTSGLDPAGRDAMLDLLLALARDHGKSFILSTHLLGDVERICDRVVILNHGQVLLQGTVAELRTKRQDRYRLQIQGDRSNFVKDLRLEGVHIVEENGRGEMCVGVPAGFKTRTLFALADNTGVILRGIQPDEEGLEEMFHRVLGESHTNGR